MNEPSIEERTQAVIEEFERQAEGLSDLERMEFLVEVYDQIERNIDGHMDVMASKGVE
jgi:hypothetical protein